MTTLNRKTKWFRYSVLSLTALALAFVLKANNGPSWRIVNAGLGKQFAVEIGELQANAQFEIQTDRGRVLAVRSIPAPSFQGLFSLEDLPQGTYYLVLKTNTEKIVQPVELSTRTINYDLAQRRLVHVPEVIVSGRQLDIQYWNADGQPVTLALLQNNGAKLYEETIANIVDIEKRLNLLKVPSGEYVVEVHTREDSWREPIRIR